LSKNVAVTGIDPSELRWVRSLISLLRHPDPMVAELTRQALLYLADSASKRVLPHTKPLDRAR